MESQQLQLNNLISIYVYYFASLSSVMCLHTYTVHTVQYTVHTVQPVWTLYNIRCLHLLQGSAGVMCCLYIRLEL